MSLTKIGSIGINTGIQFAGVTTISTLNSSSNVLSGGGTVNFVSDVSIGGTVSIAGTLTYEDVTNVDAVGLITARNGIVVGSGITLSKDGDIFATGVTTLGGEVQIPDYIHHVGDNNCKFGFESGDTFAVETAGSERVRVTSDGKFLIGTSTPQGNANADDLVVSTSGHSGITIRSGTSSNGNIFFADGTSGGDEYRGVIDYNHSNNHMSFSTNASERARVTSDGNLGIGTITPSGLLHTHTASGTNRNYIEASASNAFLRIKSGSTSNNSGVEFFSGSSNIANVTGLGAGGLQFEVAGSTRVTMSSDGMTLQNMGAGGGLAINALGATSEYGLMTANANRPSENDLLLGVGASWNGDSVAQIDFRAGADTTNKDDGKIMFYTQTSSGGGLVERMRIDQNGKVIVATGQLHSTRVLAKFGIDCQGLDIYDGVGTVENYGLAFYNDPDTNKANGIGFFNDDGQSCGGYIVHQDRGGSNVGDIIMATSSSANTPVERLRIRNGGDVSTTGDTGFTRTTAGITARSGDSFSVCRSAGTPLEICRTSNTGAFVNFFSGSTAVASISYNGSTMTYGGTSDYRLKENVIEMTGGIDAVKKLKPIKFNFITTPEKTVEGFIAHEVQEVIPQAVTGEKDCEVDEEGKGYQQLDPAQLVPTLTKALQEAVTKIEVLETRLNNAGSAT